MRLPAGGERMNNGEAVSQVADISRPLLSVSKICEKGNGVLCKKDAAYVLDEKANVVAKLEKRKIGFM